MIVFDLDDTLHLRADPFGNAVEEMCGMSRTSADMPGLFEDFRRIGMEYFHQWDKGEITEQEMYIRRAIDAFAMHGISLTGESALAFHGTYEKHLGKIHLAEGIVEALQLAVDREIRLGILTNGPSKRQRRKIAVLGLNRWIPESAMAVSSELGIHKPDERIFALYQKKLRENGTDVDRTDSWWYVGDSYENDIEPAVKAGWNTIWLNRYDADVGKQICVQPDYKIRSGKELTDILRKI